MTVTAPVASTHVAGELPASKTTSHSTKVEKVYYFMLFPAVALFTFFITLPALIGIFFSFTNYVGYGDWQFIGLTNYIALFSDPAILQSYLFTFFFAVVTTIVVNVVALAPRDRAELEDQVRRQSLRAIFFIPMVISGIVIAYVFNFLFSNSMPAIGRPRHRVAAGQTASWPTNWAWLAIVIVTAWQAIPGAMIIYSPASSSIPGEVYEAAALDGANPWRAVPQLTLPLVVGYVVINVDPRVQGLPERLRHHRRPDQRRSRHRDPQRRHDDLHRLHRRRLRLPDGQRDDLLRHHRASSPSSSFG